MRVVCLWFRVTSQHTHEISAQQEERCNTVITVVLTVLNNETSPVMEKGGVGGGPGDALRGDGTSNLRLNNTDSKNTHHDLCRGVSYQGVYEQTSGAAEDAVKDGGIGDLLLLLLVYHSLHKQLQDSLVLHIYCFFLHIYIGSYHQPSPLLVFTTNSSRLTLAACTPFSCPCSFSQICPSLAGDTSRSPM